MMPLFSIIIPHHNNPKLLRRCLDSIPHRDDIEVLIVDDHSDEVAIKELKAIIFDQPSYIRMLSLDNGSCAGAARNRGLDEAVGKWIIFSDDDDVFTSEFNQILSDYAYSSYDIVFFNFRQVSNETFQPIKGFRLSPIGLFSYEKTEIALRYRLGVPWGKMLSKAHLDEHHIRFDEIPKQNDTMFSLRSGYYAQNIAIDARIGCLNVVREGSITTSRFTSDKQSYVEAVMEVSLQYYHFVKEHHLPVKYSLIELLVYVYRFERDLFPTYLRYYKENHLIVGCCLQLPRLICRMLVGKFKNRLPFSRSR